MELESDNRVMPDNEEPEAKTYYRLPYENSAVEPFLAVADQAMRRAEATAALCQQAVGNQEEPSSINITEVAPYGQDAFQSGAIRNLRSLVLSAESAAQAQDAVCEALSGALDMARKQKELLTHRIDEVKEDIAKLDEEAAALRQSFTQAADDAALVDAYATGEAQKLLSCLESAYRKHGLIKVLYQNVAETNANLEYLEHEYHFATQKQASMRQLAERAGAEWQKTLQQLHVDAADVQQAKPFVPETVWQDSAPMATCESAGSKEQSSGCRQSAGSLIWSYLKIIFIAFLIAISLRAYVFDVTRVEGLSMYPTLADGDHLITLKVAYLLDEPQRGDIVVLQAPDVADEDYIKRIIALPNEELEIRDGQVYIDGILLDEPYLNGLETEGDLHTIVPDGFYFVMGDNRGESRDSRIEAVGPINAGSIHGKAVLRIWPLGRLGSLDE